MRIQRLIMATLCLSLPAANPVAAQVLYSVHDIGSLYPGGTSSCIGINAAGQATGFSTDVTGTTQHAFRVAPGGSATDPGADLGAFGGGTSRGTGINSFGQVTGYSDLANHSGTSAYRTTASGTIDSNSDIGGIYVFAYAKGINDAGQVAGYAFSAGADNAFRTTPTGIVDASADLGQFPGANGSRANAINASGQVTGQYLGTGFGHAFRTTPNGTLATADDLGAFPGSYNESGGNAINSSGEVAGWSLTAGGEYAFRSSPNGQPIALQDLGTVGGNLGTEATGINSLGVVVGHGLDSQSRPELGFVFDTQMHSLNDLVPPGWNITDAAAINDAGQIAATGSFQGGPSHALVLTPVPEPGSLILLGVAAGVGILRRHRSVNGP